MFLGSGAKPNSTMEAHHQRRARPRELYLLPALDPGARHQPEHIGKSWLSGCLQWESSNDGVKSRSEAPHGERNP